MSRPDPRPPRRSSSPSGTRLRLLIGKPLKPWAQFLLIFAGVGFVVTLGVLTYFWISYGHMIDRKLAGEQRPIPRIFGRPLEVTTGQGINATQLIQHLNTVGYAERPKATEPGEFSLSGSSLRVVTRPADKTPSQVVQVDFSRGTTPTVTKITLVGPPARPLGRLTLEAPLLAALAPGERRRYVPLASIPKQVIDAVLVTEDRRFFEHAGIDPIGIVRAIITNLRGTKQYLVGGSTITQQIIKNAFLTPEKTPIRKLREQFMALVLDARFSKQQILELYLNEVVLGQRGPFEIHGVPEASRIFFGKDVRNLTLAEAATLAGLIQSPSYLSPFRNPTRARDRRNVVLKEMADAELVPKAAADKAAAEPLVVSTRALENEAPYFVDYVSRLVEQDFAGLLKKDAAVDVYTTLELHKQRLAQEAVAEGIALVDKQLAARKRKGEAQVALVAVDPATGDVLAMVGGRGYSQSQYNRAVAAKRQPGSTFKPFVYLAAFEKMAAEGRSDLTPATIENDDPTTFKDGENDYTPTNYQNEYDGPITLRRALALSRNIVAVKVGEIAGFDNVAALWNRVNGGKTAKAYPSIALGVFEASPVEVAAAYTLFANRGSVRPLRTLTTISENGVLRTIPPPNAIPVARPDTTFLVTNMMRSVLNEGTGAGARGAGFTLDAAGKSGTTNDLRDAWFVGFTPELLTVVWVGFDNNQPIGLSGAQAALPIWTSFMRRALLGRPSQPFEVPENITFVDIDKDTGLLATPACPRVFREAFLAGTEPHESCDVHGGKSILNELGGFFRRILP